MTLLSSAMNDMSNNVHIYRELFDTVPNDRFSVLEVNSGEELQGFAYAAVLEKPVRLSLKRVLSLLWSRIFVFSEEWDMDGSKDLDRVWEYALSGNYMNQAFQRFVTRGRFSSIEPISARKQIRNLMHNLRFDESTKQSRPRRGFSEHCFGQISSICEFHDRLAGAEFLQAFEITNDWNDVSYFFETPKHFGYFEWGTSA
ncbi:hypothetical protein [Parasulfitobacter algicola]|uniref:DUF4375 domain-containing protein n=1 Tax=Parasulfitobacter algicola TaxID=2614809 RepID=A0ABX2IPF5_9RHOB|nr:hypothetical protein [Sulfitobacter algicola]NSX54435.1 hypothetical protein [Sulfitobacter algicola]